MLKLATYIMFGIMVFSLLVWPLITYAQDGMRAIGRALKREE